MSLEIKRFIAKGDWAPVFETRRNKKTYATKFYLGFEGDTLRVRDAQREFEFLAALSDLGTFPIQHYFDEDYNMPFSQIFSKFDLKTVTPWAFKEIGDYLYALASLDMDLIPSMQKIWKYNHALPSSFFDKLEQSVLEAHERKIVLPSDLDRNIFVAEGEKPYIADLDGCNWFYELHPISIDRRVRGGLNAINTVRQYNYRVSSRSSS